MNIPSAGGQGVYVGGEGTGAAARQQPGVVELIDQLRDEFEAVAQEIKAYRGLRDEFQRKAEEQISEMTTLESALLQMEQKHQLMKEQYESEISRLKKQLMGGQGALPGAGQVAGRDEPVAALPGLASRAAAQGTYGGQLGAGFPSAQTGNTPATKRHRGAMPTDLKPATSTTASTLGNPIGNIVGAAATAAAAAAGKEEPNEVQGPEKFSGTNLMGNVTSDQGVGRTNNSDNDYVVYQGMNSNGTLLNMNVKLQNSFVHDSVVCCVRYSYSGQYLATGSNKCAQIFDAATGAKIATFARDEGADQQYNDTQQDSFIRAVCFSPDGKWLITGSEDRLVRVWDVRTRTVKHKLTGHETDIYSVDASSDNKFIASGSGDKTAKLWDLKTGQLLHTLGGGDRAPTDGVTSVTVSPTSLHVAAGSLDKIVRVWEVETGRLVRSFEGHRDSVYSVAFSPDCRMLLSGSLDKTLKLWDLAASNPSNQCRLSFTGHKDFVLSVAFSPNGRWLISGSKDRTVQFWDPRQPSMCLMLQGHKNSVISIDHSPKGNALATGSGDKHARTWIYTN
ncbi:hypothetical protein NDN08_000519 [Rhodosorus marinus]|uniref:Transcriptional repressor Tup1 N-terminal domain-containing protein n=1 Tax=Rhodosorus marinus TaxID=101924 RepID=A0AAV8UNE0_9RHOD|nr:hypothetical protein NDN08_000519 [Rhodosorus marinus]